MCRMLNGACSRVLDPVWNLLPEVAADYYFVASGPLFLTSMTGFTRRRYRVIQNVFTFAGVYNLEEIAIR